VPAKEVVAEATCARKAPEAVHHLQHRLQRRTENPQGHERGTYLKKIALVLGLVLLAGTGGFATPSTADLDTVNGHPAVKKVHFRFRPRTSRPAALTAPTREPT